MSVPIAEWSHDDDLDLEVLTITAPEADPIRVAFTPEALLELGRQIVMRGNDDDAHDAGTGGTTDVPIPQDQGGMAVHTND